MIEHGAELADQFALSIPLNLEAERVWGTLEEELGADLQVHQHGGLMVAETPEDDRAARAQAPAGERARSRRAADRRQRGARDRALHLGRPCKARCSAPARVTRTRGSSVPPSRELPPRLGAEIRVAARVESLRRVGGRWLVSTAAGVVSAELVLIAAGIWSGEVAAMADTRLPVLPVALTMIVTAARRADDPSPRAARRPPPFDEADERTATSSSAAAGRRSCRAGRRHRSGRAAGAARRLDHRTAPGRGCTSCRGWEHSARSASGPASRRSPPDQVPSARSGPQSARPVHRGGWRGVHARARLRAPAERADARAASRSLSLAPYSPLRYAHLNFV